MVRFAARPSLARLRRRRGSDAGTGWETCSTAARGLPPPVTHIMSTNTLRKGACRSPLSRQALGAAGGSARRQAKAAGQRAGATAGRLAAHRRSGMHHQRGKGGDRPIQVGPAASTPAPATGAAPGRGAPKRRPPPESASRPAKDGRPAHREQVGGGRASMRAHMPGSACRGPAACPAPPAASKRRLGRAWGPSAAGGGPRWARAAEGGPQGGPARGCRIGQRHQASPERAARP